MNRSDGSSPVQPLPRKLSLTTRAIDVGGHALPLPEGSVGQPGGEPVAVVAICAGVVQGLQGRAVAEMVVAGAHREPDAAAGGVAKDVGDAAGESVSVTAPVTRGRRVGSARRVCRRRGHCCPGIAVPARRGSQAPQEWGPRRLLPERSTCQRLPMKPSSGGICPVRLLELRSSSSSLVQRSYVGGKLSLEAVLVEPQINHAAAAVHGDAVPLGQGFVGEPVGAVGPAGPAVAL